MKVVGTEVVQREIDVSLVEAWQGVVHAVMDAKDIPRGSRFTMGEIALPDSDVSQPPEVRLLQSTDDQRNTMKLITLFNMLVNDITKQET
jgi:hypothetical protein